MTALTLAIRAARVGDHPLLASVLVEAFQTDPLAIWLYPDPVEHYTQLSQDDLRIDLTRALWVSELATINAPPSTRTRLSFVPTFLRYHMLLPSYYPITRGIVGREEPKSEKDSAGREIVDPAGKPRTTPRERSTSVAAVRSGRGRITRSH